MLLFASCWPAGRRRRDSAADVPLPRLPWVFDGSPTSNKVLLELFEQCPLWMFGALAVLSKPFLEQARSIYQKRLLDYGQLQLQRRAFIGASFLSSAVAREYAGCTELDLYNMGGCLARWLDDAAHGIMTDADPYPLSHGYYDQLRIGPKKYVEHGPHVQYHADFADQREVYRSCYFYGDRHGLEQRYCWTHMKRLQLQRHFKFGLCYAEEIMLGDDCLVGLLRRWARGRVDHRNPLALTELMLNFYAPDADATQAPRAVDVQPWGRVLLAFHYTTDPVANWTCIVPGSEPAAPAAPSASLRSAAALGAGCEGGTGGVSPPGGEGSVSPPGDEFLVRLAAEAIASPLGVASISTLLRTLQLADHAVAFADTCAAYDHWYFVTWGSCAHALLYMCHNAPEVDARDTGIICKWGDRRFFIVRSRTLTTALEASIWLDAKHPLTIRAAMQDAAAKSVLSTLNCPRFVELEQEWMPKHLVVARGQAAKPS